MKILHRYTPMFIIILICTFFIVSCTKTFDDRTSQQRDLSATSVVQLYVATVGASRNYVYVDGKPQNGSAISAGGVFPSTAYGIFVPAGFRAFLVRDTLSASTQVPLSFSNILAGGKNYTVFTYDTITAVKQKTVETTITIPTDTTCRVRFAHFAYSPNLMPNVDIYSFKRMANVFSNISPTDVSGFVPFASRLNDTLQVRETGTSTVLAQLNGFTGTDKRSYTLVYRGSHRGASTARFLNQFVNY